MLYYLIAFCSIAGLGAYTQNIEYGSCPSMNEGSVDPYRMAGRWYEYGRSNDVPSNGEKCGVDNWNKPNNGVSKVVLSGYFPFLGHYSDVVADVKFISGSVYTIGFEVPNVGTITVTHSVLETDYRNFIIYYTCSNEESTHNTSYWVKTRQQYPSIQVENLIRNALANHGLSYGRLVRSNQQKC